MMKLYLVGIIYIYILDIYYFVEIIWVSGFMDFK